MIYVLEYKNYKKLFESTIFSKIYVAQIRKFY